MNLLSGSNNQQLIRHARLPRSFLIRGCVQRAVDHSPQAKRTCYHRWCMPRPYFVPQALVSLESKPHPGTPSRIPNDTWCPSKGFRAHNLPMCSSDPLTPSPSSSASSAPSIFVYVYEPSMLYPVPHWQARINPISPNQQTNTLSSIIPRYHLPCPSPPVSACCSSLPPSLLSRQSFRERKGELQEHPIHCVSFPTPSFRDSWHTKMPNIVTYGVKTSYQ